MPHFSWPKKFQYRRGSMFRFWRDTNEGNCQDYAWTTLKMNEGSTLKALLALLTGKAFILRAYSPSNKWLPRHAVLRYKGWWIDSTAREWRTYPYPHKPLWPALPAPITMALVTGVFLMLSSGTVFGQTAQCAPRDVAIEMLNDQYEETRKAVGMAEGTIPMEFWANETTGTWTLTFMDEVGRVCIMTSGDNYQKVEEYLAPRGELN